MVAIVMPIFEDVDDNNVDDDDADDDDVDDDVDVDENLKKIER